MRYWAWIVLVWRLASSAEISAQTNPVWSLTLRQAEDLALRTHPNIAAAQLRARAAQQVVTETRSAFFPTAALNVTAAGADKDNTRVLAGALNNPSVFERNAEGLTVSQLITDFGRTANLTAGSRLRARAADQDAEATREQILLQVARGYFTVLQAQSVLRVAEQTVDTRGLLFDQVSALASNKLRSDLDVSFARVSLEEGRLLLAKSQNDLEAAQTTLATLLGFPGQQELRLSDEPLPAAAPTNVSDLILTALSDRPELIRLRYEHDAAVRIARAEKKLDYPTIAAIGVVGISPIHDERLPDDYAAAAVNLSLPLFNGGLFAARRKEAALRAQAAEENLHEAENNVIRDVRIAWLNLNNSVERLKITETLLRNATRAFDLAQARYKIGSSSIVELSQALLNRTAAEIEHANARYGLQIQHTILNYQIGAGSMAQAASIHPGK
jgi:outer membrane protein